MNDRKCEPFDFYLSSAEGYSLDPPRQCRILNCFQIGDRSDLLLVEIHHSWTYRDSTGLEREATHLLLAPRHAGTSLHHLAGWPIYVHVAVPKPGRLPICGEYAVDDIEVVAWGEINPPT